MSLYNTEPWEQVEESFLNIHSDHVICATEQSSFITSLVVAATGFSGTHESLCFICSCSSHLPKHVGLHVVQVWLLDVWSRKAGSLEDSLVCGENTIAWKDSMIHKEETAIILNQTPVNKNSFTSSFLCDDVESRRHVWSLMFSFYWGQVWWWTWLLTISH